MKVGQDINQLLDSTTMAETGGTRKNTFEDLPAEIKNEVYELSGCLDLVQFSTLSCSESLCLNCALCTDLYVGHNAKQRNSLWVDRNSGRTEHGGTDLKKERLGQSLRSPRADCSSPIWYVDERASAHDHGELGFKGNLAVWKLKYPFCYCEGCIRRTIGEL